jgi:hypothetical protein
MNKRRGAVAGAWVAASLLAAPAAFAAGGHHGVDDANTLPAGRCEQEDWFTRGTGADRMLHAGLNCGVGALELGVAGEHTRDGVAPATAWNLEAKWATGLAESVKVGLDVQPVWQVRRQPHFGTARLVGLATWTPAPAWSLHLNLGHDFVRGAADFARYGVGVDWSPLERWTFTAEGFTDTGTRFVRAGARWAITDSFTLDLSGARRLSGPAPSNVTVGVTFGFE